MENRSLLIRFNHIDIESTSLAGANSVDIETIYNYVFMIGWKNFMSHKFHLLICVFPSTRERPFSVWKQIVSSALLANIAPITKLWNPSSFSLSSHWFSGSLSQVGGKYTRIVPQTLIRTDKNSNNKHHYLLYPSFCRPLSATGGTSIEQTAALAILFAFVGLLFKRGKVKHC